MTMIRAFAAVASHSDCGRQFSVPRMRYRSREQAMPKFVFVGLIAIVATITTVTVAAEGRPNILWLTSEDHSPHMGCYGDKLARTPNVDALAAKGMLFQHAWSCYPVCAPARSTIISGMYPASTGAEHMRSMVPMPTGTKMYP